MVYLEEINMDDNYELAFKELKEYLDYCTTTGCYMPDVYSSPYVYFKVLKLKQLKEKEECL